MKVCTFKSVKEITHFLPFIIANTKVLAPESPKSTNSSLKCFLLKYSSKQGPRSSKSSPHVQQPPTDKSLQNAAPADRAARLSHLPRGCTSRPEPGPPPHRGAADKPPTATRAATRAAGWPRPACDPPRGSPPCCARSPAGPASAGHPPSRPTGSGGGVGLSLCRGA